MVLWIPWWQKIDFRGRTFCAEYDRAFSRYPDFPKISGCLSRYQNLLVVAIYRPSASSAEMIADLLQHHYADQFDIEGWILKKIHGRMLELFSTRSATFSKTDPAGFGKMFAGSDNRPAAVSGSQPQGANSRMDSGLSCLCWNQRTSGCGEANGLPLSLEQCAEAFRDRAGSLQKLTHF